MNTHIIPKEYLYFDKTNGETSTGIDFYRNCGSYLIKRNLDIVLDVNITKEGALKSINALFNEVHNKKYYKNFKLYELSDGLIFTNRDSAVCGLCEKTIKINKGKMIVDKGLDFQKPNANSTSKYISWYWGWGRRNGYLDAMFCKKCYIINKIKQ